MNISRAVCSLIGAVESYVHVSPHKSLAVISYLTAVPVALCLSNSAIRNIRFGAQTKSPGVVD